MDRSNQGAWRVRHLPAFLALVLPWALLAGCTGPVHEKGLVPVSGRVTLDGGPWPKPGTISFAPMASPSAGPGGVSRPASAAFDTDGKFSVTSYEQSPGLYPGEYSVTVECWEEAPGMDEKGKPTAGKSAVPKKYMSGKDSGLTLKVESGSTPNATFDVKSK